MKEIVTGACLLAIAGLALSISIALNQTMTIKKVADPNHTPPGGYALLQAFAVFLFIVCGFSGCGIFIRGVIR